jgi:hypothetical protein
VSNRLWASLGDEVCRAFTLIHLPQAVRP